MATRFARQTTAPTKWLLMLGLAVTLSFSAICGWVLWQAGGRDYLHSREAAANLVSSLASEIDRNIELYDLSLQAVVDGMKLPEIDKISPELRQVVLFDRAATAKDMGSILVTDRLGKVVLDSHSLVPAEANYSGRDFFQIHVRQADAGLYISRPWVAPDGQYLIGFSRRIANPDGSFGGIVAGSMHVSYFHNLFRKLKYGPKDSMNLIGADGTILMRAPFDIDTIGQSLRKSQVFQQFPQVQNGWYETVSILDGVRRLFVFQQVGHHPLLIVEGVSLETIYADWWREVWLIGSIMLALCAMTMALTVFLALALKRRTVAENQLARLASTDGLTGLCNRRKFDEVLSSEWRRSQRSAGPLALLMIDADGFKAYNDAHGHQAGDAALASIAECIANGAKRASDLSARYGGEEFAVLLPGESTEGACRIAEEIRASVLSLRSQQQGRPDICPTISIGVASMVPQVGLAPSDLIKSADLALYEAKHAGRNRTVAAPTMLSARRDLAA
ncbi:sensor domain-containing diguanylate cyclase [Afipia sp. GAS231]|uniref:sensor domain-containing diguanylate cyclase n=1 Tax=Afipia sp. GAS231 TaxID=1882747 RepID=UPI00087AFF75|nr:sensor domain-containing diguanylate cyclase [Afipia sp. GAS231]SDN62448.1 diguanylate cyclase [Afipia sp. GAS231]